MMITQDDALNAGVPAGSGQKAIVCGDLLIMFTGRVRVLPAAGKHPVTDTDVPGGDSASVALFGDPVSAGRLPFWAVGVYLDAYEGEVQLDSLVHDPGDPKDDKAWGRFSVHARRRAVSAG